MSSQILSLNIGSQTIKAILGEGGKNGQLSILKLFTFPSRGIKQGAIDDFGEAALSISSAISDIRKISNNAVKNIILSVGSPDFKIHFSKGSVAVSKGDLEIQDEDVNRAIEAARAYKLPPNRIIIHTIVKEFTVDDIKNVKDPIGMVGNKLEVELAIIDAFAPQIKNFEKAIEMSGGKIAAMVFEPVAAARAALSKNQKALGSTLIDIGFGKTSLCVYEDGKLIHAKVLPLGAANITNDLAIGIKIPINVAENIKNTLGYAIAKAAPSREIINLKDFSPSLKDSVSRRFVAEVIEERLAEIFGLINNELGAVGKYKELPAGAILCGGIAKMPSIIDLAKKILGLNVQIAIPEISEINIVDPDLINQIDDPMLNPALGTLLLWNDDFNRKQVNRSNISLLRRLLNLFNPK